MFLSQPVSARKGTYTRQIGVRGKFRVCPTGSGTKFQPRCLNQHLG